MCRQNSKIKARTMEISVQYLRYKFDEFNTLCFGGELPPIALKVINAKSFMGQFSYRKRRVLPCGTRVYGLQLKISSHYDMTKEELDDTLLHEMIHYYIFHKRITDTSPHGRVFRQLMHDINSRYGRHVTISNKRCNLAVNTQAVGQRQRCVVRIRLSDGKAGVKVVPATQAAIRYFVTNVRLSPAVRELECFLSADPFFERFPSSRALRVHVVDETELDSHLATATRVDV